MRWIAVSVAALAAALLGWKWLGQGGASPDRSELLAARPEPKARAPVEAIGVASPASNPAKIPGRPAPSRNYAAGYHDAVDLLAFLNTLAPAADGGDANAMYWMFRASRRCVRDYMIYFGREGHERTLESVLAERFTDNQSAREIHAKCAAFKSAGDNPYRDWRALLKRATEAGNPIAEATQAAGTFDHLNSAPDAATQKRMVEEMTALARDALRSKDPAVLMQMAQVSGARAFYGGQRGGNADDESSVWVLAACQRGYDCGADDEDFRYVCALDFACQPFDTFVDMIRRAHPENFDELELRANELNAKLDADQFDEIDL